MGIENKYKQEKIIFEIGVATNADFYLYKLKLESVTTFEYLGVYLFNNGTLNRNQKIIVNQAAFATKRLFSIFINVELPICQIRSYLFFLHFGSEIFGTNECKDFERIYSRYAEATLC